AVALLRLSLGSDRQPRRRPPGDPARQARRARAGGEVHRGADPAVDRSRILLGRARGARPSAADGLLRAALHLRLSVLVRLCELHPIRGARVRCLWPVAAARPARADEAPQLALRANLADRLLLPYLWLGASWPHVLFGRCRPLARPRSHVVAGWARGRAAYVGDDASDPRDAHLAQRDSRRPDDRLVQLEGEVALDLFGAARPLEMVRHRLADRSRTGLRLRALQPQARAVAEPRFLGDRPCRLVRGPASDHLRLGLRRYAAGAVSDS